jgi:hypothetical protein
MSIKIHHLTQGTKIYKGFKKDYQEYIGNTTPIFKPEINQPVFFTLDADNAEQYGVVVEYETTRDFNLVEIDNLETMQTLYEMVPPKIQKILAHNYGYNPTTNTFGKRISVNIIDKELSAYLCSQSDEYDGYIILSRNMKTDFGGYFHQELAICRHQDKLKFNRVVNTDAQIASKMSSPPKHIRKGKRPSPPPKTDDDDDDDDKENNLFSSMKFDDESPVKQRYTYESPVKRRYGGVKSRRRIRKNRRHHNHTKTKKRK